MEVYNDKDLKSRASATSSTQYDQSFGPDVVSTSLPDGKHKIEFFSHGVLEVTTLECDDGGVTFYDVDGNEVNMDDLNDDDDDVLEKRVSKGRLAIKFAKLIAKYGKRAWTYIYCVGTAPF
ncbi:hypothetical protein PoHVEF18_007060 [Penicillium ochrochloron]